jgi:hypothetical protein
MVYAEIALQKKVNRMTMRASSISKIIVPTTQDIPGKWKFIGGRLGRMMDHVVISTEKRNGHAHLVMMIKQAVHQKFDVRKKA